MEDGAGRSRPGSRALPGGGREGFLNKPGHETEKRFRGQIFAERLSEAGAPYQCPSGCVPYQ